MHEKKEKSSSNEDVTAVCTFQTLLSKYFGFFMWRKISSSKLLDAYFNKITLLPHQYLVFNAIMIVVRTSLSFQSDISIAYQVSSYDKYSLSEKTLLKTKFYALIGHR